MTLDLFDRYSFPKLTPDQDVRRMNLAERQVVEVAKALARNPKVLILDEATSALAPSETQWLLGLTRKFARDGGLVVFISHRLGEVREIADRITIFRNGATVAAYETAKVDDDTIIADMLGRQMERLYPERVATATRTRRDEGARPLGAASPVRRRPRSHRGRSARRRRPAGPRPARAVPGFVRRRQIEGRDRALGRSPPPSAARARRSAAPTASPSCRRTGATTACCCSKSVRENLTLSVMSRFTRHGLTDGRKERALVDQMIAKLKIKVGSPEQLAGTLSGGNQQKVIFGKMLLTEAKVLLLYDPTRGIDVGTKGEIFHLMRDLAAQGYAILFYSSDLDELVHVADRVMVLRRRPGRGDARRGRAHRARDSAARR